MAITSVGGSFPYNSASSTVPTSIAITTVNVGDLILLANWGSSAGSISSVSDSGSRISWKGRVDANNVSGYRYELWWGVVTSVGSTTVSATWTTSPSTFGEIIVDEFTLPGVASSTTWALEVHGTQNTSSGTTESFPSLTSTSASATGLAYIGFVLVVSNASSAGSTTGFTYHVMGDASGSVEAIDGSAAASTNYAPTSTQSSSGACGAVAGIFSATNSATTIDGTAAFPLGTTTSATGTRTTFGTVTAALGPSLAATGTKTAFSAAAFNFADAIAATGTVSAIGAAAFDFGGALSAVGGRFFFGTATFRLGGSVTAILRRDIVLRAGLATQRWLAFDTTSRWEPRTANLRWTSSDATARWVATFKGATVKKLQSAESTEYVSVTISATIAGVPYDPSGDEVYMAFPAPGAAPTTWYAGSWEAAGQAHNALCLVGPNGGTVTLTKGTYSVYVKVVDNPEEPVVYAGTLTIAA